MVGATGVALGIILFAKAPKHSQWRVLAHLFLALGSAMIAISAGHLAVMR